MIPGSARARIDWDEVAKMPKKPEPNGASCRDCNKVCKRWYKHLRREELEELLGARDSGTVGTFLFQAPLAS